MIIKRLYSSQEVVEGLHLADVNEQAQERFELIEAQMRSAEGVTEDLKAQNPMEWVRRANNIRNRAQEIVLNELVYV